MRPRIVLDTNLLLASIGSASPFRWLFDALLDEAFVLVLSTSILLEYEEVLARKANSEVAQNVVQLLAVLPNVESIEPVYRWRLISRDPDDNKFVDAALQAGVDALVTHDRHFDVLTTLAFPRLPSGVPRTCGKRSPREKAAAPLTGTAAFPF